MPPNLEDRIKGILRVSGLMISLLAFSGTSQSKNLDIQPPEFFNTPQQICEANMEQLKRINHEEGKIWARQEGTVLIYDSEIEKLLNDALRKVYWTHNMTDRRWERLMNTTDWVRYRRFMLINSLTESFFDRYACSIKGAIGFNQLMPETARDRGVNPYNKQENWLGAVKHFRWLYDQIQKYGPSYKPGEVYLVLTSAYHMGHSRLLELGPVFDERKLLPDTKDHLNRMRWNFEHVEIYSVGKVEDRTIIAYLKK